MSAPSSSRTLDLMCGGEELGDVVGEVDALDLGLLAGGWRRGSRTRAARSGRACPTRTASRAGRRGPSAPSGCRSLERTICTWCSWSALKVWKNSSAVLSLPARNCTSSTRSARALAVLAAELVHEPALARGRLDELVRVALGGDDGDAAARLLSEDLVRRWRGGGGSCRGRSRRAGRAGCSSGRGSGPTAWAAAKAKRFDAPTTKRVEDVARVGTRVAGVEGRELPGRGGHGAPAAAAGSGGAGGRGESSTTKAMRRRSPRISGTNSSNQVR